MPLSISLFDFDGFDGLIEAAMPGLPEWAFGLAFCLVVAVLIECAARVKRRSPVEKLVRRRLG